MLVVLLLRSKMAVFDSKSRDRFFGKIMLGFSLGIISAFKKVLSR